jgi:hypothetical protein
MTTTSKTCTSTHEQEEGEFEQEVDDDCLVPRHTTAMTLDSRHWSAATLTPGPSCCPALTGGYRIADSTATTRPCASHRNTLRPSLYNATNTLTTTPVWLHTLTKPEGSTHTAFRSTVSHCTDSVCSRHWISIADSAPAQIQHEVPPPNHSAQSTSRKAPGTYARRRMLPNVDGMLPDS